MTLATIANEEVDDTLMYSESISRIPIDDIIDADIIFLSIFTFAATRGYKLAKFLKKHSKAIIVLGGLHASMNYKEAVKYCDYVMTGEGDETILQFIKALKNNKPLDFPGLAYIRNKELVYTGNPTPPENIDTIPNRYLVYNYHKMAAWHYTIWPQVHASRGCPHNCDYCAVVRHFGHKVRTRTPANVVADIEEAILFHQPPIFKRLMNFLWITDDNFFANRSWAIEVLTLMIHSDIICKYKTKFSIQARYEVGFDDEILDLLKKAGFAEVAMGIEFIEDESFKSYHKKSTKEEIIDAIKNIQKHGINVRGLFIMGSDNQTKGAGKRLAEFVDKYHIKGVLIQSMYFVPGTPVYDANKDNLLHENWSKYRGHVVHYPKNMSPYEMQLETIDASRRVYSLKNTIKALLTYSFFDKALYLGEAFWQMSVRSDLKKELVNLPRTMKGE
jgi:radical SAM superfamily enzyme YgiQ (UPF0313 family)